MKTYFWDKLPFKTTILAIVPLVIGAICSALGDWNFTQQDFIIKFISLIIIGIIYIILLLHYSKNEANMIKVNNVITKENEAFTEIMKSLISIFRSSTEGVNVISKTITKKSKIDLNIWSFDKASMWICTAVHQTISKIAIKGDEFGVSYVKLLEENSNNKKIKTVGFHNNTSSAPKVFDVIREVEDLHGYYDTKLFKKGDSAICTIDNPQKIFELFEYENREDKNGKYSQYIALPVFCNDKKMIGLLQVVSYKDSKIEINNEKLERIAKRYLISYVNFLAFLSKVEKGLLSMPNVDVESREI